MSARLVKLPATVLSCRLVDDTDWKLGLSWTSESYRIAERALSSSDVRTRSSRSTGAASLPSAIHSENYEIALRRRRLRTPETAD